MGALVGFCCVDLSDVMGQQKGGVEALADVDSRIGVSCDIWWAVGLHKKTPVNAAMAAHRIIKLAE